MTDRELLETVALENVAAIDYYDLADNLEVTTDEELMMIIGWE